MARPCVVCDMRYRFGMCKGMMVHDFLCAYGGHVFIVLCVWGEGGIYDPSKCTVDCKTPLRVAVIGILYKRSTDQGFSPGTRLV